jgi:cell division protein FtsB
MSGTMRSEINRSGLVGGNRFYLFKALFISVLLVVAWLLLNVRNLREFLDTYSRRNQEQQQIELMQEEVRKLERQHASLASNGQEMEKQIRERWGMHKPGENVIFLRSGLGVTSATLGTTQPVQPSRPNLLAKKPVEPENARRSRTGRRSDQ